jgi:hypothetical protein
MDDKPKEDISKIVDEAVSSKLSNHYSFFLINSKIYSDSSDKEFRKTLFFFL